MPIPHQEGVLTLKGLSGTSVKRQLFPVAPGASQRIHFSFLSVLRPGEAAPERGGIS